MHVQMIDVDDVRGFGESLLDVAVLEDAAPDDVGPHRLDEEWSVAWRDFAVNHSLQRLVFDAHQLGGVFGYGRSFAMIAATGSP